MLDLSNLIVIYFTNELVLFIKKKSMGNTLTIYLLRYKKDKKIRVRCKSIFFYTSIIRNIIISH